MPTTTFRRCPGKSIGIANVGAEIVNLAGTEPITTQEYCEIAGEMLGKEPIFVENSLAWPIWGDTTKMVRLLGPNIRSQYGVDARRHPAGRRSER